ncbi:MAG: hypothetical protein ACJ761_10765 [Chloroflexota bacterium]
MLLLVAATAAIIAAAAIVAGLLPRRGIVAFGLAVAMVAQAIVVVSVGGAGLLLHDLSPAILFVVALGWLVGAGLLAWRREPARRAWPDRVQRSGSTIWAFRTDLLVVLAGLLVLATLVWRAFLALRLPIVDYDGWSYHLVFVDVWLQHNALTDVPQRIWTTGYPANTELLTTWLAAFTRTDALAGFTSILPIPAAILATTGLARSLGASARFALLAGLLFGMTPALVALAGTTYVDASSVAFVVATWWLGLRVIGGERDSSAALLLGIAGGLAVGSKGTNVLLVTPILVVAGLLLLVVVARSRDASTARWRMLAPVVAVGVPVLLLGGSWYAKNLIEYGNPLYPFAVGPFRGPTTLVDFAFTPPQLEGKGLVGQLVTSWTTDWRLLRYSYNVRPGGLGRDWIAIIPLAIGGLGILAWRRQVVPIALVAIPAATTLLTMPMPWYARLTLFLPALALPLAALALTVMRPPFGTLVGLGLIVLASVSLLAANGRPNIDIRSAVGRTSGWPTPGEYVRYLLDPSDAHRADVSLRRECAGFDQIPAGAAVVPAGFNLLHGVVGPSLSHVLTTPVPSVRDPRALAQAARERGAAWLVTSSGGSADRLAASAPDLFVARGDICQGARLWQLRQA